MTHNTTSVINRFGQLFGSKSFFRLIIGLLIIQALWIALTGRYPMAFDEDYHLGIIRLYAHHVSPFWSGQPAGADAFGAVARDPSYLFHWLMSFPYRLISLFTDNQTIQVIFLRLINIGLFASALPLYRKLLLKSGASKALVQSCLGLFILIPVVPLLAAQINYDNLLLPLTAVVLLLTISAAQAVKTEKIFPIWQIGLLLIASLFTSVVKYAFLPIVVGVVVYILFYVIQKLRHTSTLVNYASGGFKSLSKLQVVVLVAGVIVGGGLFFERYGINTIKYHTPIPDCGQVLTVKQCSHYGPWIRDYNFTNNNPHTRDVSPRAYMGEWFYGMWLRLYFAVDGPSTGFQTRGPFIIPAIGSIVIAGLGVLFVLVRGTRLLKRPEIDNSVLALFGIVSICYIVVLWLTQYQMFVSTAIPVAINGRYALLIMPLLILILALAYREVLRTHLQKTITVLACFLIIAWGGGALTYILRSNDAWYWSSPVVRTANQAVQRTLGPLTPGYHKSNQFLR